MELAEVAGEAAGEPSPARWERWAALYGRSVRTLERWSGAPFEHPARMAEWWRRTRKHRVPARLLELEAGGADPAARPARPAPWEPGPVAFEEVGAGGAESAVEDLRQFCALYASRLRGALEAGDSAAAANWQTRWERAVEQLRRWEKDLVKIQVEQGSACTVGEIAAELIPRLSQVKHAFEAALCRALQTSCRDEPAAVVEGQARGMAAECFAALASCRFLPPRPGGEAAAA